MNRSKKNASDTSFIIPERMKAVVLGGTGRQNLQVREIPVPPVGNNQLLCRVDAAGVCTSLLKIIAQGGGHSLLGGWDPSRYPVILGDEGSLTAVKIGKNLKKHYHPGQRFALQPAVNIRPLLHRERYQNRAREMHKCAVGYTLGGCLAEYLLIQEEVLAAGCLIPLKDKTLPYFAVALAEPIGCVLSAQRRHLHFVGGKEHGPRRPVCGLRTGGSTLIIGAGIMGRINAELAMRFKPERLFICDTSRDRLRRAAAALAPRARKQGIGFRTLRADILRDPAFARGGGKADDVIVAVGRNDVQQAAFGLINPGGVINLFGGLGQSERFLQVDSRQVHYDEITIVGSSGGDPYDLESALDCLVSGEIDAGNYVWAAGSLEHVPEALELMRQNIPLGRVIIYPGASVKRLLRADYWDSKHEKDFLQKH
jgi:L-sorbose 1-phosphate reductase